MTTDAETPENINSGTPGRIPQAERTRNARRALLTAASDLFGRHGYVETSLAMVGTHAGYSRGIVGYHFRSKEALAHAVIDHLAELNNARLIRAIGDRTGFDALDAAVDYYCDAVLARPANANAIYVFLTVATTSAPELREHIAAHNAAIRRTLAESLRGLTVDNEEQSPAELELLAGVIEGAVRGIVQQYMVDPEGFDLRAAASRLKQMTHFGGPPQR
jgi:AcrR family transcriptional regulator